MTAKLKGLLALAWRFWPATAGAAALVVLASAHFTQHGLGFEPCPLCLRQREVYWAALAVVALGAAFWLRAPDRRGARAVDAVLTVVFLTSVGVAAYHAGVEWKWWPGPPTCSGGIDLDNFTFDPKALETAMRAVRCDEAAFRILGLSMAGWNVLISLGLAGLSAASALRRRLPEPSAAAQDGAKT